MDKKDFIREVLKEVKFKFDHKSIREELENHIEDRFEDYMDIGSTEAVAMEKAVACMGNPKEIGIALNKVHSPLLGWIWWISRAVRRLVVAMFLLIIIVPIFTILLSDKPIDGLNKEDIVYHLEVDYKFKLDDVVTKITDIVYDNEGDLHIYGYRYDTKLWGSGWSQSNLGTITDANGKTYGGGGFGSGGIISYSEKVLSDFDIESESLIISYDNYNRGYYLEIPLEWEYQ